MPRNPLGNYKYLRYPLATFPSTSTDLTHSPFLSLSLSLPRSRAAFLCDTLFVGSSTGFRHASQHWSITCLSRGQGYEAAREHIRRSLGLSLSVRRDLHTLRHREQSRLRALHTRLQFSRRGELSLSLSLSLPDCRQVWPELESTIYSYNYSIVC